MGRLILNKCHDFRNEIAVAKSTKKVSNSKVFFSVSDSYLRSFFDTINIVGYLRKMMCSWKPFCIYSGLAFAGQ